MLIGLRHLHIIDLSRNLQCENLIHLQQFPRLGSFQLKQFFIQHITVHGRASFPVSFDVFFLAGMFPAVKSFSVPCREYSIESIFRRHICVTVSIC